MRLGSNHREGTRLKPVGLFLDQHLQMFDLLLETDQLADHVVHHEAGLIRDVALV